ncbi:AzlD domain-containing protein [Candidatus Planktophila dulcis]|uniref:AzlD domain-containing protein n=1 Tax=Candidatus Planktophila dulcis TaxID=1884914 RepID=UPI003BEF217E
MNALWIGVLGTSAIAFTLKYLGHSIPEKYLTNPRMLRINTLIPIALLSALVGVQTITEKGEWVIDQRLAGVAVALIALSLKAPYFVVVISAAITSAVIYRI